MKKYTETIMIKCPTGMKAELKRLGEEHNMSLTAVLLVAAAYQYPDSTLKDLLLGKS